MSLQSRLALLIAAIGADVKDLQDVVPPPGAWTAYTPEWKASTTSPVVNNGSIAGFFIKIGPLVHWRIKLLMGSTTTFGSGNYSFSLPPTCVPVSSWSRDQPYGQVSLRDASPASAVTRIATPTIDGSDEFYARSEAGAVATHLVPWTWANGDSIGASGSYQCNP